MRPHALAAPLRPRAREGAQQHWLEPLPALRVPCSLTALLKVLDKLPASYLRVIRLVCRQWEGAAARLMRHLRPEALAGRAVGARFRHLHSLVSRLHPCLLAAPCLLASVPASAALQLFSSHLCRQGMAPR